jgi:DNA-binding transcriptional MerR regulator
MVIVETYGPALGTGEEISEVCEAPGEGRLVVDYKFLAEVSDAIKTGKETKYQRQRVEALLSTVDELEQELEDQRAKLEGQLDELEHAIATLQVIRADCSYTLNGKRWEFLRAGV